MVIDEVVMGLRLLRGLPPYLRRPLTLAGCRDILRRRLERRGEDFLDLARRAVFGRGGSPYAGLLRNAGCEYGDLENLVRRDGLESSLLKLFRSGVFLTTEEYKGRRPVVRGGVVFEAGPSRLRNPLIAPHYFTATSGSRGEATSIPLSLAGMRDRAVDMFLALDARGGARWRTAVWGVPIFSPLLWFSAWGSPAARWFWPLDPRTPGLDPRYTWSARALVWTSRLAGVPLPAPEYAPIDAPSPILGWMSTTLAAGEVPHLFAFASSAVRLCRAAGESGTGISGAKFTLIGEPVTEACLAAIRDAGAEAVADYGSADSGGSVSQGCLAPEAADDVHVFSDLNALIQADASPLPAGIPAGGLLLTTLRPTSPFIFLNVSLGDRAVMTARRCGCPMETLGWRTHLHSIRSFEKMTVGGVTFVDSDVVRILEEGLPRRFGGGPTDYQLVEEPGNGSPPSLRLLIHPRVGAFDPEAVSEFFLDELGSGSGTRRAMALQLGRTGFFRVERGTPIVSASGKILHLWAGHGAPGGGDT